MPYRKIAFAPSCFYHLYNRGCAKEQIFREKDNYLYLLRLVHNTIQTIDISIIAFCLMPNHYHFLVRQNGEEPAGKLPQIVFNRYSKAYNQRYNRSGTLFEGRYKAVHVDRHDYLIHLCRYIHANPVKSGLVKDPKEWPYSNYPEWISIRNGNLYDLDVAKNLFPDKNQYKQFVMDYIIGLDTLPDKIQGYLFD